MKQIVGPTGVTAAVICPSTDTFGAANVFSAPPPVTRNGNLRVAHIEAAEASIGYLERFPTGIVATQKGR